MTAKDMVQKMVKDFEKKSGKPPTEIKLAPLLYDNLKRELQEAVPGYVITTIDLAGVRIERASP